MAVKLIADRDFSDELGLPPSAGARNGMVMGTAVKWWMMQLPGHGEAGNAIFQRDRLSPGCVALAQRSDGVSWLHVEERVPRTKLCHSISHLVSVAQS